MFSASLARKSITSPPVSSLHDEDGAGKFGRLERLVGLRKFVHGEVRSYAKTSGQASSVKEVPSVRSAWQSQDPADSRSGDWKQCRLTAYRVRRFVNAIPCCEPRIDGVDRYLGYPVGELFPKKVAVLRVSAAVAAPCEADRLLRLSHMTIRPLSTLRATDCGRFWIHMSPYIMGEQAVALRAIASNTRNTTKPWHQRTTATTTAM